MAESTGQMCPASFYVALQHLHGSLITAGERPQSHLGGTAEWVMSAWKASIVLFITSAVYFSRRPGCENSFSGGFTAGWVDVPSPRTKTQPPGRRGINKKEKPRGRSCMFVPKELEKVPHQPQSVP